jgi:HEAT repeat protein
VTGKTYLVFAKQPSGSAPDVCQQVWQGPIDIEDEGALLCPRQGVFDRGPMKDIFWRNLTELLKSTDAQERMYAITHLDQLSGEDGPMGHFGTLSEFQRLDVLKLLHGLINDPDPTIAQAALMIVGSHNPYMTRERAQFWLATVGSADTPGYARMDPKMVNEGGLIYWREIAAVVDGKGDETTRAVAATALGLVREPSLQDSVTRWLADPSAKVRSAAVLLLADYLTLATHDRLASLAGDADAETRISAAFAIGFGQIKDDADVLTRLMTDLDAKVRQAASMSLLSFSPKDDRIAKIFRDNLSSKEFGPLFLVALAQEDPGKYVDLLIQETVNKTDPTNWQGGQIPAFTASHLLYKYLDFQSVDDAKAGKFDRALDALESWKPNYSVDPQFVYALELRLGLTDRAKKFRAAANKTSTYDLETFFKRVDENPASYDEN